MSAYPPAFPKHGEKYAQQTARLLQSAQKILTCGLFGSLLGGGWPQAPAAAQVPSADLHCYVQSPEGVQYDLSALCPGFAESQAVVLQTGDVQVTLRWNTADDLDLYVRDPFNDEVSYFNPAIASGGQLDIDANAGCAERMAAPVENIFWPTGGGAPGNYVVRVELFSHCGAEVPISFTLDTLIRGEVQTRTGNVSASQTSVSFPFTFPAAAAANPAASGASSTASVVPRLAPSAQTLPPVPTGR